MCLRDILAMHGHMNVKQKKYWHWSELSYGLPIKVKLATCVAYAGTRGYGGVTQIFS
jgi:hypothetical protein